MPVAADGARGALGEAAAAAALRQAASLALRRGHPQVTPLHVACAIVMSPSSSSSSSAPAGTAELLLRAACPLRLQIHLDAALGRLPLAAAAVPPLRGGRGGGRPRLPKFKGPTPHQYRPNLTTYASCYRPKFRELTAENLKIMCDALEVHVPPRHRGIVPGVASTVLRCRSGTMRRRQRPPASTMTWLLFRGKDRRGKKAMALELARLVFGSYTEFTSSDRDPGLKIMSTGRHAHYDAVYVGTRLLEAILENPHRVVFINDIDDLDHEFMGAAIMNRIVTGRLMGCNGSNGGLEEAIIVLSSDEVASSSSPRAKRQRISSSGQRNGEESPRHFRLDLNTPAEDQEYVVEEEEDEEYLVDKDAGIMGIVDGVFRFN
ncbi:hypothetical protein BRADI_4g42011v3 [Brachypodium distachyon]|uniref:Clp R domain-containing protein n=1 Tax=Brachypodium distachyon TaxID=15368 RepID=A0A0Q3LHS8_BRADI|nr:hypothetical protein BRADI_4g42011v3 [Brachypodium distachyon]